MTAEKRHLDDSWQAWLKENIDRRCNPEQLLGILLKNNFTLHSIKLHMGEHFPAYAAALKNCPEEKPQDVDYAAISETRLTQLDSGVNALQFLSSKIQLYTIDNFLSEEKCTDIRNLFQEHLRPSTVTRPHPTDPYYRTSSTCDLSLLKHQLVDQLDEKICRTLGIRPAYAEGTQGQHYEVGQEFKQHTDYFNPDTQEFKQYGGSRGNRTWTFMVYLNTVPKGGGTQFIKLNHVFQPQAGKAVIWNNVHPDGIPNHNTLHAGMPVLEGCKDIITKWFREKGVGEMFYEPPACVQTSRGSSLRSE